MTARKPPTPQGISALLRKAGLSEAEVRLDHPNRHPGFRIVPADPRGPVFGGPAEGSLWVGWADPRIVPGDYDTPNARIARVLTEAGYAVRQRGGFMVVTAPESAEGE